MTEKQKEKLSKIIEEFRESIVSFVDNLSASSDEKSNAIAKALETEASLKRKNDDLQVKVSAQSTLLAAAEEIIKRMKAEKEEDKQKLAEMAAEIEQLKLASKPKRLGLYRQPAEKAAKEPKRGFRVE